MSTTSSRSLRAMVLALGWILAAMAAGCGGKVIVDGTSTPAPDTCPAEDAGATIADNCHKYCAAFNCLDCPMTAAACEPACNQVFNSPLGKGEECLACAVEHVHELTDQLSCTTAFGPNDAGMGDQFTLVFSLDKCPMCSSPH